MMTSGPFDSNDFKLLFDLSPDMLCLAGSDGYLKVINPSFSRVLGYDDAELLAKPFLEYVHPDDVQKTIDIVETLKQDHVTTGFTNRYRHKDGTYRMISWSAYYRIDTETLYSVGRDITAESMSKKTLAQIEKALEGESIIAKTDRVGRIVEVNDNFCQISGYSRDELLGQNHRILNSGAHDPAFFEDMWETITAGKVWSGQIENRRKNGEHYNVLSIITPIFDIEDKISQFLAIRHDATGHIQTEQKLERTLEFLNETGGIAKVGGWELDVETGNLNWTDETFKILEVEKKDGQSPVLPEGLQLFTDRCRPIIEEAVSRAIEFGEPYSLELEAKTAKGNVLWVYTNGRANYKDGKVVTLSGTIQDIDARKRAEQKFEQERQAAEFELRHSELQHRLLFTNMLQGVVYRDSEGRVIAANPAAEQMLGLSLEMMRGQTIADLRWHALDEFGTPMAPDDFPAMRVLKTGQSHLGVLMQVYLPALSEYRWILSDSVPQFLDGQDKPYQVFTTFSDITEQRNAEQALQLAKDMAEKANMAKNDFLSSMSHELRTPLNGIMGFGQLLEMNEAEPLTEAQQRCVDYILKGGEHLVALIDQVLDFSRIESGTMSMEITDVPARVAIDECLSLIQARAADQQVALIDGTAENALPVLRADKTRLIQAILNLLSNAVKYNKTGGKVYIEGQLVAQDKWRITIKDTGAGIPLEKQQNLFKPFDRLGRETGDIEGTGIGLTITQQIVELLGGVLGFDSEEGKGSQFWMDLPLSQKQTPEFAQVAASKPIAAKPDTTDQEHVILYVEDNLDNLHMLEMIIARLPGMRLVTAHTGEEGLDTARELLPDLILMDINLPGINGDEALKLLRADDKMRHIPVIAISANAMLSDVKAAIEDGFDDYITKPFLVPELIRKIADRFE